MREADLHGELKYKQTYPKMEVKGKEKVGDKEAYLIEATPATGSPVKLYFDAQTWMLIRRDEMADTPQGKFPITSNFEDFREVDGVKIFFTLRQELPQAAIVVKITEVKHNVPIDDAKFNKPSA
jgi:zinc protease